MKLYPSLFKAGDRFSFKNRHGEVVLEAIENPRPVNQIRRSQIPKELGISFDEVEQIALITDQVRLQPLIDLNKNNKTNGFIRHSSACEAAICKVVSLSYSNPIPAKYQIQEDMNAGRNLALV